MKTISIIIIASALLVGCASNTTTPSTSGSGSSSQRRPATKIDENEKAPFIGMTKAQARARYGEPKKITVTSEGENWVYVLNMGEFVGKHMIPFFFSETQLRTAVLIFGPDGKVIRFNWDKPTE